MLNNFISVVICTYNRCESLKETLNSILAQECDDGFDYEVIVVNNNSKDRTKEVVESYISKFKNRLRYIFEVNQGLSYARNVSIKLAKGNIIAFTDDDVVVFKDWLKNIYHAFKENKNVVCVGGKIIPIYKSRMPDWLEEDKHKGVFCNYNLGSEALEIRSIYRLPVGANMAMLSRIFNKYGYFNTNLSAFTDTEMCSRILKNNEKIIYHPEICVYHMILPERFRKKYFCSWYFKRGKGMAFIREDNLQEKKILSVPRWIYRQIFEHILAYFRYTLKGDSKNSTYHQMNIIFWLGFIYVRWFKIKF